MSKINSKIRFNSLFSTICTLLQLKICSNESLLRIHLEETIKQRIRTDINDSFAVHEFVFNDKNDIQLTKILTFIDFVTKLTQSMSVIHEYQKLFTVFNVNYIKICFFETNSAADQVKRMFSIIRITSLIDFQLSALTECLLTNMTEYFRTYSKPTVRATSSIYDPNLIQSSKTLFDLYSHIQTIVGAIQKNLEKR